MTVEFIFVLSPNNSGTTIIGQYLQAQTGGYLPPFGNNEGQMAPSVRKVMRNDPWNPARGYDWSWIRAEWTALAAAEDNELFIECSPPNILRVDAIRQAFDGAARYLFSISSPYSFISSAIYNYHAAPLDADKIRKAANGWLFRAEAMQRAIETNPDIPRISYEDFCRDPGVANAALDLEVRTFDRLAGKGNEPIGEVIDMSARHHSFLTFSEWNIVNAVLAEREDLLAFHGYGLVPGEQLLSRAAQSAALMHAGILRRALWEDDRREDRRAPPSKMVWTAMRRRVRAMWQR